MLRAGAWYSAASGAAATRRGIPHERESRSSRGEKRSRHDRPPQPPGRPQRREPPHRRSPGRRVPRVRAARKKDLLLVSGASTLPGLSAAVVDELAPKFSRIESVQMSIAPAHKTPRGRGTVAAVLSYCGSPFKTLRDGQWTTVYGWQDLRLQNYPELGKRLSAACDVPDLALLPDHLPGVKTVSFHAALEATWEQLSLWLMAWFTRLRIVRSWQRFIPFFTAMSERLIFLGSARHHCSAQLTAPPIGQSYSNCPQ